MNQYSKITYLSWLASANLQQEAFKQIVHADTDLSYLFERFMTNPYHEDFRSCIPESAIRLLIKNGQSDKMIYWQDINTKTNSSCVTIYDMNYPKRLLDITDPPLVLFFQGNLESVNQRCISMIGSRRASYNGLSAARKIAKDLSLKGICIISGLAYGIDKASHEGCLQGNSPTVAVVGNGLDKDYPVENIALKKQIIERGGAVISEYPPGEQPLGWHFPVRNRIISGLGNALVVMEATVKSGSMTTVRHALDQGKDIFVYPGDPSNQHFAGNHQLLREGALYFTEASDILEDMRWLDKLNEVMQNNDCSLDIHHLSGLQKKIYEILQGGESSFDSICKDTAASPGELMGTLTVMQINGYIEALPGKYYRIRKE